MKQEKLSELRKSRYFVENIRWDLTPKLFLAPQTRRDTAQPEPPDISHGYMLYVDLVNENPAVVIMDLTGRVSKTVGWIDAVPEDLLREAMQCEASACVAGMYPLTERLQRWIRNELGID